MRRLYKTTPFREKGPPTGRPFFVGIRPFFQECGLPRQRPGAASLAPAEQFISCAHWLAMANLCKMSI